MLIKNVWNVSFYITCYWSFGNCFIAISFQQPLLVYEAFEMSKRRRVKWTNWPLLWCNKTETAVFNAIFLTLWQTNKLCYCEKRKRQSLLISSTTFCSSNYSLLYIKQYKNLHKNRRIKLIMSNVWNLTTFISTIILILFLIKLQLELFKRIITWFLILHNFSNNSEFIHLFS